MLRFKQTTYESRYNDNTKRPKLKENQLKIFKNIHILPENSAESQAQERVTYLSMRIHWKSCSVVPGRGQLGHSSHIVKVVVKTIY